jgi:uncharacterized membrane protein (DUF485 family)
MSQTDSGPPGAGGTAYEQMQASPEFVALRRRLRNFVFPLTAAFIVWYFLFVLLSTYASDFMGTKIGGNITVGLVFGLLQFVSTFAITMFYARWANREYDPAAEALRAQLEGSVD